jgi:hypothetical protein
MIMKLKKRPGPTGVVQPVKKKKVCGKLRGVGFNDSGCVVTD